MKLDYMTKELLRTFYVSTVKTNREAIKRVRSLGRWYDKHGTEQVITYVGHLYKVYDKEAKKYVKVLHIGMAKQNPFDLAINMNLAKSIAETNAVISPVITTVVGDLFDYFSFEEMCKIHLNTLKLEFVRTKAEFELGF